MRKRKKNYKSKKQKGGLLRGPSHAQGGIPAKIQNGGMVELEGGEYIINAQTVNAVGTEYLDKLNSTATTYHQGGFNRNQLGNGSLYKKGGKVKKRKLQEGGNVCPPGQHWMPAVGNQPGYCMEGETHEAAMTGGGYKGGGKIPKMKTGGKAGRNTVSKMRNRKKLRRGGRIKPSKFATGGAVTENIQKNMSFTKSHKSSMRRRRNNAKFNQTGGNQARGISGGLWNTDDFPYGIWSKGGKVKKLQEGGMANQCPPGQYMQNGQCVSSNTTGGGSMGGYRTGGQVGKFQEGGQANKFYLPGSHREYLGKVVQWGGNYYTTKSGTYEGTSKILEVR